MKPTLACGHTEYDRGHCGMPGCPNDYRECRECNPAAFPARERRRDRYQDPYADD